MCNGFAMDLEWISILSEISLQQMWDGFDIYFKWMCNGFEMDFGMDFGMGLEWICTGCVTGIDLKRSWNGFEMDLQWIWEGF